MNDNFGLLNDQRLDSNFKYFCGLALVPVFVALLFSLHFFISAETRSAEPGERFDARVTKAKKTRGKKQETSSETALAASESGPILYKTTDSFSYKIWFVANFDPTVAYDSQTKMRSDAPLTEFIF